MPPPRPRTRSMEDDLHPPRHHPHSQHQQPQQTAPGHGPSPDPSPLAPQHHHSLSLSLPLHLASSHSPRPQQHPQQQQLQHLHQHPLPLQSIAPPPPALAAAKALSNNGPDHPPPPDRHSRDDCWSEGATNTLIDAWGDRYLELNRGNLKQKHWKDVADAVNAREDGIKAPKTDMQCKNRLDTLKKKYKVEKGKIVIDGGPSKWAFYERLDELIGPSKKQKQPTSIKPKPNGKRSVDEAEQKPIFNTITVNNNNTTDTNSKSKESPDMTDSCPHGINNILDGKSSKRRRLHDSPFKDLARAILKFGEVYERIESSKQQQLMDLEKQRMEFTKDLELQRMQLFMQTQLELAKMKHGKHGSTEHYL